LQDAFSDRHDLNRLAPGLGSQVDLPEKVSRDGSYTLVGDVQAAQIPASANSHADRDLFFRRTRPPHLYDEQGHARSVRSRSSSR